MPHQYTSLIEIIGVYDNYCNFFFDFYVCKKVSIYLSEHVTYYR